MNINYITLHCSDSDVEAHDDISVIAKWHSERGWVGPDKINGNDDDVGYSYFVKKRGSIQKGRDEGEILAHARGHNSGHIAICLHGRENFTDAQFFSLRNLVQSIMDRHVIKRIYYHNELNSGKTCPNFKLDWVDNLNEQFKKDWM